MALIWHQRGSKYFAAIIFWTTSLIKILGWSWWHWCVEDYLKGEGGNVTIRVVWLLTPYSQLVEHLTFNEYLCVISKFWRITDQSASKVCVIPMYILHEILKKFCYLFIPDSLMLFQKLFIKHSRLWLTLLTNGKSQSLSILKN